MNFHFRQIEIKKEPVFFSLIQFFYWSSNCVLYSFLILYMKKNGFSDITCGIATTLLTVLSLVVQPLMGYVTDTFITSKKLLIGCFMVAMPFTFLIPKSISVGYLILLTVMLQSLFDNYQYAIIDSWIIRLKNYKPYIDFGQIRAMGSISYGLTALIFGNIIARLGFDIMFVCHASLLFMCLLCMLPVDEVPCLNKKRATPADGCSPGAERLSPIQVASILVKNKPYMIFLISVALYQFAIRPTISYLPLIVTAAGGDSSHYGLALCLSAMTEAPVMYIVSRLTNKGLKMPFIYTCAMVCGVIRLIVMSLPLGLYPLIFGQLLSAVTIGTYIRVFTEYIAQITPKEITSSASTLGTALTFGIGGVLGNLSGGFLISWVGIPWYLRICAVVMALSALVITPSVLADRKNGINPVKG